MARITVTGLLLSHPYSNSAEPSLSCHGPRPRNWFNSEPGRRPCRPCCLTSACSGRGRAGSGSRRTVGSNRGRRGGCRAAPSPLMRISLGVNGEMEFGMATRRTRFLSSLCLLAVATACARTHPARTSEDSTTVASLIRERLEASLAGDTARWHRQVSDGCVWTGPGLGTPTTAAVIIEQAANLLLHPTAQQIQGLTVHVFGDVAQATYLQLVQDAGQTPRTGKRFRKTDTYIRHGPSWLLIGATEIALPFRRSVPVATARLTPLLGSYLLGKVDSVRIALGEPGQLTMNAAEGAADTLFAENDSTFFIDGEPGAWVFRLGSQGRRSTLAYRSAGGSDVTYTRGEPR